MGAVGFGIGAVLFFLANNQFNQDQMGYASTSGFNIGGIIFAIAALIFLAIALWAFFRKPFGSQLNPEKIEQLKTSGQKIMAQFKAIDRQWNVSVNGRSPIVIYAQDDLGRTYKSAGLWFAGGDSALYNDPSFQAWQKLQSIDPTKKYIIPVYLNPLKLSEYYMDLAGLQIL